MRPIPSIYLTADKLHKAQDSYDAGKKAFKAGVEHSQENMPEEFHAEWSDGWIDAYQKSKQDEGK